MKKKILTASLCAAILLSSLLEDMPLAIGAVAYEREPSAEETACFDLEYGASTLAAPTASKESGTITCSKDYAKIKLSAEKGTIYYSLNGEDYKKYTSSIKLTKNSTIKAYAQSGSTKSETVTFTYKLKPEVTVDVSYAYWGRSVALDTKVSGVKIYYTTDGSKPTTSSKQLDIRNYGDAVIQPSKTTKLRVLAVKSGWASARLTENIVLGDRVVDIADPKNDFPLFTYREKIHQLTYVGVLEKEIVFPSEVDGMPVKSVATDSSGSASFYLGSIERITIPDSVTYLGDGAFSGCGSLKSLVLPDSITSIGDRAFAGCSSLESINIPSGVTKIGEHTFDHCTSLKSITIPSGVTEIGQSAFYGCTSLKSVNIPSGVRKIGYGTFEDCTSLTSITLPDSVKLLDPGAFENCTSLKSVTMNGVTEIGYTAFAGCTSLKSITIPDGVTYIASSTFEGCTSLKSITIPDGVTEIYPNAFKDCTSLESITLPNSVTEIGAGRYINIMMGIDEDNGAFLGCDCTVTYKGKKYTSADNYEALYAAINGN